MGALEPAAGDAGQRMVHVHGEIAVAGVEEHH